MGKEDIVELRILGITFSQIQAGAYALLLEEKNGQRRVPIIIGTPEAQSIAIYLENLNPPRPLTHDLFFSFVQAMNAELKNVNIYRYEDGIFYSELIFTDGEKTIRLDSRTSDAIALAIRADARIFTTEEIMKEVSIIMEEEDILEDLDQPDKKNIFSFESMTMEELQDALDEAVSSEDYERASFIRDLMNKKK
ncbi:MAG: bifunctional nuclease family protein [Bacteroidales bacterium]|nr:bifunctional nuclease family protein [Bacteroidales bacterium]